MNLRFRHSHLLTCAAAAALSATAGATPVFAQTTAKPGAQLEEIVVTARRREENLQSVPVAVTAVSGKALRDANIVSAADLVRIAPSVATSPGSTRGFNQLIVSIRGLRNDDPSPGADPSVGIYFAEVPQNVTIGTNSAFFDLRSVEVLKGPQGTLFGRNATGGAVLINPTAPRDEFGGYVRVSAGNYALREFEGAINAPVGDTLAVRLSGIYTKRRGFLTQVITGVDLNDVDRIGARLSLKWKPTDNFESTTIATTSDSRSHGEGIRPIDVNTSPGLNAAGTAIEPNIFATPAILANVAAYNGLSRYSIISSIGLPKGYVVPGTGAGTGVQAAGGLISVDRGGIKDTTWSIQNTSVAHFGEMQVKNIIGWRVVHDHAVTESDGTALQLSVSDVHDYVRELSEELQVSGTHGKLTYVAGVYFFRDWALEEISTYPLSGAESLTDANVRNTSYSVFGDATYDLGEMFSGLSISAGLRLAHDRREVTYHNRIQASATSSVYTCKLTLAVYPSRDRDLCVVPQQISFTQPTGQLTLSQKLDPDHLLYASYRHGYRSGGYGLTAGTFAAAQPYMPEKVDAFEIGSKNTFTLGDVPAQLNVAGYYTKEKDVQRSLTINLPLGSTLPNGTPDPLAGTFYRRIVNAAQAHIWGGEVEFNIRPSEYLQINAGYAFTKPKYDQWFDTLVFQGKAYAVDISDSHFVSIPEHTLTASATITLPTPEEFGRLSALVSYSYQSKTWILNENNTSRCTTNGVPPGAFYNDCYNNRAMLSGYGLVNLRLNWTDVMRKGFDINLFVNNVANKFYYSNGFTQIAARGTGLTLAGIGAPRMFGIELRTAFGGESTR